MAEGKRYSFAVLAQPKKGRLNKGVQRQDISVLHAGVGLSKSEAMS